MNLPVASASLRPVPTLEGRSAYVVPRAKAPIDLFLDGDEGEPPPKALLVALAARLPLGIATGRPRKDAERFLEENGLSDIFRTVVTIKDAPRKPDSAPVQLARERLGASWAWLVGDTPDDVRAARAAGALGLGVVAPGADPERTAAALIAAGAGRVLSFLSALLEVLP